jgi:RNA polymerase sigma-70 factor, ECF subfamily
MEEPDPATVRSAAAGDRRAFARLVRHTQDHVWRFIRHQVGDDELASDLTQETFLRVHASLRSFRGEASFGTWLLRIARNLAVDERRRAARRPVFVPVEDSTGLVRSPGPSLLNELDAALDSLPPDQRDALLLVEILGLRYREAALILEVADGTVKSRVFHARAALTRWMTVDELDERPRG